MESILRAPIVFAVIPCAIAAVASCSSSSDSGGLSASDASVSDGRSGDANAPGNEAGSGDGGLDWISIDEVGHGNGIIVDKVTYASGSLVIGAQICRPDDAAPHPMILFQHGGFQGLTTELFQSTTDNSFCENVAKNGYVVGESSYRGEDGSQGKVEVCLGEVDDVIAMLAILRTKNYVDSTRIAALGGSHGGCITDQVALREPTLKSAVDYYGPTDWAALDQIWHDKIAQNEPDPWCALPDGGVSPCFGIHQVLIDVVEGAIGGTPAQQPAAYAARSTATKIGSVKIPIAILQGTDDALVDLSQGCTKRAAFASIDSFYLDTTGTMQNPGTVCGGNFLMAGLPNGQTAADYPHAAYYFVLQGQGHGFTGTLGDKANTLALQFLVAKMNP